MILASFNLWATIKAPFRYLLQYLADWTGNFGWALILFAVLVKLVLFLPTAKSKKNSMKIPV